MKIYVYDGFGVLFDFESFQCDVLGSFGVADCHILFFGLYFYFYLWKWPIHLILIEKQKQNKSIFDFFILCSKFFNARNKI
jgi:hypothetical protein